MGIFPEYESYDGLGLARLIKEGDISPLELLETAIARIELWNPSLNAVIYKMYQEARDNIPSLPKGLFYGVPFLLKDMLADYKGAPMRFGSRFMEGYISSLDSELVKRFKQAGLNILGKTNLPEFGLSPVTEPELCGPTHNPWDLTKSPGGSSGGSAAAVASRMVPMAHGGDGGGSLRIPAAYCGLLGLKPSRGRTPTGPYLMRISQGLVVEHVLTRSVRDSAAMLDILAGPEMGSPISLPPPKETYLSCITKAPNALRIGMTDRPFFASTLHPEYKDALKKAAHLCEALGHRVEPVTFQLNSADTALAYLIIAAAEVASSIDMLSTRMLPKNNHHKLETATAVLYEVGEHFSAKDFAWASQVLDTVSRDMAECCQHHDVLMLPTMPGPPLRIGEFKPGRLQQNVLEILRRLPCGPLLRRFAQQRAAQYFSLIPFTPIFNITGQPALSVPLFWDTEGMPIGIQFAARFGDEKTLFQLAQQLETAHSWLQRKPKASPLS